MSRNLVKLCRRTFISPLHKKVSRSHYESTSLVARQRLSQYAVRQISSTSRAAVDDVAEPKKPRKRTGKRTTVKFKDLPQGLVAAEDVVEEPAVVSSSSTGYPTVVQQARDNMAKFHNCVVITRVGSFYELYFDQAEHWSSCLNIKLASRKTSKGPVPMAGFPVFQLERYLKMLIQDYGVHVAIAEETANDPSQRIKTGGLMFDRRVKRIVTPGTLIDESFLSPLQHNYLLGIFSKPDSIDSILNSNTEHSHASESPLPLSLAWIDLSSGDFFTQEVLSTSLTSVVARLAPGEIVVDGWLRESANAPLLSALEEWPDTVSYSSQQQSADSDAAIEALLKDEIRSSANSLSAGEMYAASGMVSYVNEQLLGSKLQLQAPRRYKATEHMSIDRNTLRGLEITKTMRDGTEKGTLLHSVRRTSTKSGARLLSLRLVSPSTSLATIEGRLDLVQELIAQPALIEELTAHLQRTTDSLRLVQAIAFGKGDAQDLLNLARTITITQRIAEIMRASCDTNSSLAAKLDQFRWEGPIELAARIQSSIDEEGLMARYRDRENDAASAAALAQEAIAAEGADDMAALHKRLGAIKKAKTSSTSDGEAEEDPSATDEIWIMRRSASTMLARLHDHLAEQRQEIQQLTSELQQESGARSLSLKTTPGLGHILHVKGKDTKTDFADIIKGTRVVSASKTTLSLAVPAWTSLGARIEDAKMRIRSEEQQIFRALRESVCENIVALRRNANVLDEIDVACSSATLADECNLVRPLLDSGTGLHIVDGRHVTVEAGLRLHGRSFTPNDTEFGKALASNDNQTPEPSNSKSIHLITGPNMAGKSTYLRQTALIAILAQTGLYVPAGYARIGLLDAVFSRIGSADNLYQDQSTFMVEMLETAEILKNAGPRSLVIMDEVGRGTSPEGGVAVGYAVLETLRRQKVARILFATHFHEIIDMCQDWAEAACYCTRVVEEHGASGSFRFDHKMRLGVNRNSHALNVARLAGLPKETVEIAQKILEKKLWDFAEQKSIQQHLNIAFDR